MKIFPLLPIPIVPSPLYLVLNDTDTESRTYPALMNSFALLRFFAWVEKVLFDASAEVGKAKKQKVRETMRTTLVEVRFYMLVCKCGIA